MKITRVCLVLKYTNYSVTHGDCELAVYLVCERVVEHPITFTLSLGLVPLVLPLPGKCNLMNYCAPYNLLLTIIDIESDVLPGR